MIRIVAFFTTLLMVYLFYGLYVSTYKFLFVSTAPGLADYPQVFDYRGVTHSHSNISTGIGPPEELILAAQNADMNFLFITDVNTFEHAKELEGYHDDLLVLTAAEFDYLDAKFLHFNRTASRPISSQGDVQVRLADILSNRATKGSEEFLVLTHPLLERYRWNREYPPGLSAIEVFNFKSMWQQTWSKSALSAAWSILVYPFNPQLALLRLYYPPLREISLWDELNRKRPTIGYLGHEATARALPFKDVPIRFPSYEQIFKIGSNHLLMRSELTGNSHRDREKILTALQNGHFYMCVDLLGDPTGFNSQLVAKSGKWLPGSRVAVDADFFIETVVPKNTQKIFEVRYYHNGQVIKTAKSYNSRVSLTDAGTYRVEVWINSPLPFPDTGKSMLWIATNPFFVSR